MSTNSDNEHIYWVEGDRGGYSELFNFEEACEIAKQDSIEEGRTFYVVRYLNQRPSVIFHTGWKYLPEQSIE